MKEVIAYIKDGDLVDKDGTIIFVNFVGFNLDEYEKPKNELSQLMSLGATPDDLIKMKANGLL